MGVLLRGGCPCDAVRFEITDVFDAGYCHCIATIAAAVCLSGVWWIPPSRSMAPPPTSVRRATTEPTDDETQRLSTPLYRAGTSACQMDIAVRQQVRRDGSWESLLVPKCERPSLPPEERREFQRQFRTSMSSHQQQAAFKEVSAWQGADFVGPVFAVDGSTHWSFSFEDRPETCFDFEAVGDFHIERSGLRFSFPTGLPADLNRFVIERADLDPNRRRLYFTHGDCLELFWQEPPPFVLSRKEPPSIHTLAFRLC
jgi:hypothetical protein